MQMLNRYFAPYALLLILSAIWFTVETPTDIGSWDANYKLSLGILAASAAVNWWLNKNMYRFYSWAWQMRALQVWLDYVWAAALFWLLQPYWAPMWLLFVMSPATAALFWDRWKTLGMALISAGTMLAIYWQRGVFEGGGPMAGMAVVHAAFIVVLALFVHGLAQAALRLRDAAASR